MPRLSRSAPSDLATRRWQVPALVAAVCAVIYVATANYSSVSGDVTAADVLSWQIGTTSDPVFDASTFPPLDEHPGRAIWIVERPDGHEVIGRSPGAVLAGVPAYAVLGRGRSRCCPVP